MADRRIPVPELKKFLDKRLSIKLNGTRKISGILRGYDQFMNLVLDETVEEVSVAERNEIGMVVRRAPRRRCTAVHELFCTLVAPACRPRR